MSILQEKDNPLFDELQKEMHRVIAEVQNKAEKDPKRFKNLTYQDCANVYFLCKIGELKNQIDQLKPSGGGQPGENK